MLLALALWVGGIVYFTAIAAPAVLQAISDRAVGGALISRSLVQLHNLGITCAVVFLGCSLIYLRRTRGEIKAFAPQHLLVLVMLACTLVSQRAVLPAIALLRMGPQNAATVAQFQRLHSWSVGLEGATLLFGLILLYLIARRLR